MRASERTPFGGAFAFAAAAAATTLFSVRARLLGNCRRRRNLRRWQARSTRALKILRAASDLFMALIKPPRPHLRPAGRPAARPPLMRPAGRPARQIELAARTAAERHLSGRLTSRCGRPVNRPAAIVRARRPADRINPAAIDCVRATCSSIRGRPIRTSAAETVGLHQRAEQFIKFTRPAGFVRRSAGVSARATGAARPISEARSLTAGRARPSGESVKESRAHR